MANLLDSAMEAVPPLAYTSLGFGLRRRLGGWQPLAAGSLAGKVVVVTGASRGIGEVTADALEAAGATVERVSRSGGRAADMSDLDSVRELAAALRAEHEHIDVLIHNAGAISETRTETADGVEMTWALMVLGPVLLTELLADRLAGGRVVWVTSGGMYTQRLHLEDLEFERGEFDGTIAYARCKRAQVDLVAEYAARGLPAPGAVSVAVHPGWADTPGVEESLPSFHKIMGPVLRTPAQGADTMVWLAGTDEPLQNGALYFDRRPRSVARLPKTATSAEDRRRLWDAVSGQLAQLG